MSKQELIIETLSFTQNEEKDLLKKSGKTLGEIVDTGFTEETRVYVELMTRLYKIYDDLEKGMIMDNVKNIEKLGFVKLEPLKDIDLSKMSEMMKNIKPVNMYFDIPQIDLTNLVMRRRDD
jgi:hypothetical protein